MCAMQTDVTRRTRNRLADECFFRLEGCDEPLFTAFDTLTWLLTHLNARHDDLEFVRHCERADVDVTTQTKDELLDRIRETFEDVDTNDAKAIRCVCAYPDEFYSFYIKRQTEAILCDR